MLPKFCRLNLKTDFKRVVSGKSIEGKYLKLFIKESSEISGTKVGIALSSKNFKRAHERNRAKRLTSKAFEQIFPSLPQNLEIIALPKPAIINVKSDEVTADLKAVILIP